MVYIQPPPNAGPKPGKKTNYLAWIFVVFLPALALIWYLAPNFVPMWRWQKMDFPALAKSLNVAQGELEARYDVTMRYAPRGLGDPAPWQIMTSDPLYKEEEEKMWVRCSFISDRTGGNVSDLALGSGTRFDKFWKARVWRFPPGAFGHNAKRPVLVYDASTLVGFDKNEAAMQANEFGLGLEPKNKDWLTDDTEIDDGYRPVGTVPDGEGEEGK